MLSNEKSIGNYFTKNTNQFVSMQQCGARETMVLLMEELTAIKGYQELTLYLAVNISDLYMVELARRELPAP